MKTAEKKIMGTYISAWGGSANLNFSPPFVLPLTSFSPLSTSQELVRKAPSYGSTRICNGILEAFFFLTTSRIVFVFVLFCEALGEALNKAAAAAAVPEGPLLPLTRPGSCTQEGPGFGPL
jgi:hypothetical protein